RGRPGAPAGDVRAAPQCHRSGTDGASAGRCRRAPPLPQQWLDLASLAPRAESPAPDPPRLATANAIMPPAPLVPPISTATSLTTSARLMLLSWGCGELYTR